ncbi:MAG: ATP-binding protein [Lachnospiraceae bacterium]|nr:ATP-binding protein [Lachnospiraceae bacterium]
MPEKTARLPMGIESFKEIRTSGFYYIDKTGLIRDLLENIAKVNLFTRPRRFGKTLNMSMLKYFFETGCDSSLFDDLNIAKEQQLCREYMGRFPVISISLKDAGGTDFKMAKDMLRSIIGKEALRSSILMQSEDLSEIEQKQYRALVNVNDAGDFTMSDNLLSDSLLFLSQTLQKHYHQNVIILIDEYDVPLNQAYEAGYYDEMTDLIRKMFGKALKTNECLQFAVLTGCMRISKESIFTGMNNFSVYTVQDVQYNEYFGFTDMEVRNTLDYYGFGKKYDTVKEWYDGYRFGSLEIYCPWDVVSYCHALRMNPDQPPQNYWVNTSSNDIIRRFVRRAKQSTRNEIEQLIDGKSIWKEIRQELTYRDIDSDIDNLWSMLFTTGYLTQSGEGRDGLTQLVIPNREIHRIYIQQIQRWFQEEITRNDRKLKDFCLAFQENNTAAIEEGFNAYLRKTISIRDTNVRKDRKENFYHGILLGILSNMDDWDVRSNTESGDGYCDITVEIEEKEIGFVIELKYAENAAFDDACKEAVRQIRDRRYEEQLMDDGMKTIYRYGIACYKRRCKVVGI